MIESSFIDGGKRGMRTSSRLAAAAAIVMLLGGQAGSADLTTEAAVEYCRVVGTSDLILTESDAELKQEVVRLMDEAIAVANSDQWIYSSRPAFVWASEAKVACGMAYGYLKTSYRDEDTINKCECFHSRMVEYMN